MDRLRSAFDRGQNGPKAPAQIETPKRSNSIERSLARHSNFAILVVGLLIGGLGLWSALTNISGAIVA
jgi:hypothetical protein